MKKILNPSTSLLSRLAAVVGVTGLLVIIVALAVFGLVYGIYLAHMPDLQGASFFDIHRDLFLIGLVLVPRITLLINVIWFNLTTFGALWWLAWFIAPRFLIAGTASALYWDTNPILVVLAWALAIVDSGTSKESEKSKGGS